MRVAIVGATGNAGTALLRALQSTPEVTSVLGIARRMPDADADPYRGVEWRSIDVAAASSAEQAGAHLREAFAGVDTVVHLAWLVQPNTRRELLRRVNVEGTRRVAMAAAAAGVGHLVVASSVGAYAPDRERTRRNESWRRGGIRTSHYSVDKAAQERVLDEFGREHPEVIVTRLRPALIFGAEPGSQIQRYFLSGIIPVQVLGAMRPMVLPLPAGFRGVQSVHAADLGGAYAAAITARAPGAFNICADDVLESQDLADIIDHGRFVSVPPKLMRGAMALGHGTRALAADPGWFDMAMYVPMMDNARAKAELGWSPRFTAADALRDVLEGMIAGRGTASVPMRPRDATRATVPGTSHAVVGDGAAARAADVPAADARPTLSHVADGGESPRSRTPVPSYRPRPGGAHIDDTIADDLLNLYLSDHLTGATAGAARIARMANAYIDTPVYAPLSQLATEIALERAFLGRLIDDFGMRRLPYRQIASWVGERAARLKNNGVLTKRSPMTLVLETELMRSAIMGKLGVWQVLEEHAEQLGIDRRVFADLARLALEQVASLNDVHEYARSRAFRTDRLTFTPFTAGDDHAASDQPGAVDDDASVGEAAIGAGEAGDEALDGDDARLGASDS